MRREQLPIWRSCNRLLMEVKLAVKGFSRYHKYTIGTELRQSALQCCRLLVRALNSRNNHRLRWVARLQSQCDDVKLLLQLGKELKVFASFAQFQKLVDLAIAAGKQVGRWQRWLLRSKAGAESV
ncbi:MAG: four helix bundle protein [Desulfobacterales bacterium]|nr:four helix bundle protein [Desulfobacterales bacterium]